MPSKKPQSFIKNLKPLLIENRNKGRDEKSATDDFNKSLKQGELHVHRKYLDKLVEIKRARKREGGEKSHKTRKRNSVKHLGKK